MYRQWIVASCAVSPRNVSFERVEREEHVKSKAAAANMADIVNEVAQSEETQPELVNGPSLDQIRLRAYEIHFERGCIHGRDQDD
jgi:hypothetical protein